MFAFLATDVSAQNSASIGEKRITVKSTNSSLRSVLDKIQEQSGALFVYVNGDFDDQEKISIDAVQEPLNSILITLFRKRGLTWQFSGKTVRIGVDRRQAKPDVTKTDTLTSFKGIVRDSAGSPIPGVSVTVAGIGKGGQTDRDGNFIVSAKAHSKLRISAIGYESIEVSAEPGVIITVRLLASSNELKEVIATGYQFIARERATGSYEQIDNKLLNRRVGPNILDRLEGIVPGLLTFKGYDPPLITIRGTSSIFGNQNPLIVLDNFPYYGNINNINPNDVQSITVLKDAASASIWGVQAGNGVIVITTKKGAVNQKVKIDANINYTLIDKPDFTYDKLFLPSSDYIKLEEFLFNRGFYTNDLSNTFSYPVISPAVEIFEQRRLNKITSSDSATIINELSKNDMREQFRKYIYQKQLYQQYAINAYGGGNNSSYSVSFGYDKNPTQLKGNDYGRFTMSSNIMFRPIKRVEVNAGVIYTHTQQTTRNIGTSYDFLASAPQYNRLYPYAQFADENGNPVAISKDYRTGYTDTAKGFIDWKYRPLDEMNSTNKVAKMNDILVRVSAKYDIMRYLDLTVQYQFKSQVENTTNLQKQESYYVRNLVNTYRQKSASGQITYPIPIGGIYNTANTSLGSNYGRAQLNFRYSTSKNHYITSTAGAEIREQTSNSNQNSIYGYNEETGVGITLIDYLTFFNTNPFGTARIPNLNSTIYDETVNRYISYFANASYTFQNKYTIYGSIRKDGANLFGVKTNHKVVPLWSVGANWSLDKEDFYDLKWLPQLKIKASYGFNGNVYNGSAFLTAQALANSTLTGLPRVSVASPENPQLRWEKVRTTNAGIEFATSKQRLSGTIEFYQKEGIDLVEDMALAPSTGFTTVKANAAKTRTNGIDITLNSINILGKFSWTTSLNLSLMRDKVTKFDKKYNSVDLVQAYSAATLAFEGNPLYSIYSYRWAGIDPQSGNPRGYLGKDISTDYVAIIAAADEASLVYSGPSRPTKFGALRNNFSYQGFSLSANIIYKLGYYYRNTTTSLNYSDVLSSPHQNYIHRWKTTGDELKTNIPSLVYVRNDPRNNFYKNSSILVEKADHIRLQDISLEYDLKQIRSLGIRMGSLTMYGYVNNIGLLWKANKSGVDPDFAGSVYVAPKSYAIGIRAGF